MGQTRTVDGRDLPAPEPMERVLEALDGLPAGDTVRFLIHREPFPLYDLLRRSGFVWQTEAQDDGSFVMVIRHAR